MKQKSKKTRKIPSFRISETIEFQDPDEIIRVLKDCPTVRDNKSIEYINAPVAFDIETTSFRTPEGEKAATMYLWGFGVGSRIWYGRTWEQFDDLIERVRSELDLGPRKKLFCFVHNLAFEFGFIGFRYRWTKVFSIDSHKPLYADYGGFVFRCSYLLTGYPLALLNDNVLSKYKCEKLVGDLDYNKIRHSGTVITPEEIGYLKNDVQIVLCLIQEKIEAERRICWIPLTKTGYVRRGARKASAGGKNYYKNRDLMQKLILTPEEYILAREAFAGGFVHANVFNARKVLYNVGSFDICSSYPAAMIAEQYPMGRGTKISRVSLEDLARYNKKYCTIFRVRFGGLEQIVHTDTPLSGSKCRGLSRVQYDNGRVVSAATCETTLTNVDWSYISAFYTWERAEVFDLWIYEKAYLPTRFIAFVVDLFRGKSELKSVPGKEEIYIRKKEDLNSCYGMMVTDVCKGVVEFSPITGWLDPEPVNIEEAIEKYNKKQSRFLSYLWGIFVTAYARRNLLRLVWEAGEDHAYSDTDSDKILNPEKHLPFVERYNKQIEAKIEKAMLYHGLPADACRVKNAKGIIKSLGTFEYEGKYSRFKTLGAKRYMFEEDGEIFITVAGVNKRFGREYIAKQPDPFTFFDDDMTIPAGSSGKNIHTYIDEEISGTIIDYNGIPGTYHEKSCVHLEESDYHLSIADNFIDWIMKNRIEY
ncbi:MAG: hypothetical protein IIY75_09285 [Erysipelotrichales bacterium]|nr:hypothetical protein [Erysipelotrichales bacterium]